MSRVIEITKKLVWGLSILSAFSCLIRNDFNIVFAFFILIILNNYYENNTKLFTKIIFQLLIILIAGDFIWFFVMWSVWGQTSTNLYWQGQSSLQTFALVLCWAQIALKGFIAYYLFLNYSDKNPNETNLLFNLNYKMTPNAVESNNSKKEDDFKNPYDN
jgi:hypothetical protein